MATEDCCRETRKFWIFWILGFLPLTLALRSSISYHNRELKNHLKGLNKPYVKSIKSPDGDIIDCVLINKQPAFDNPLLKNHTIQMRPSFYPGVSSKPFSDEEPLTQLWQINGGCSERMIPIRRTREEDLLRANSLQRFGKKTPGTITNPYSPASSQTNDGNHEYAVRFIKGGKIYGAKAAVCVWNPRVQEEYDFSLAQLWLVAGDYDVDLNTVEAGWQVYPRLYGDNRTRLFAYWTRDAYKLTGCYNLLCSSFVQTTQEVALGASISPISSYDGNQYEISVLIFKDPKSGNWWLQFGDELVGYWPSILFTHLQHDASEVQWGGEVFNQGVGGEYARPEMGSGRLSEAGFRNAAKFRNLEAVDESNILRTPPFLRNFVTRSGCYDTVAGKSQEWGQFFFYGGPGRNPDCR